MARAALHNVDFDDIRVPLGKRSAVDVLALVWALVRFGGYRYRHVAHTAAAMWESGYR